MSACPKPRTVSVIRDGVLVPISVSCKSRRCPVCGIQWAADSRRRLLANISHYGGDVALATVTAPGNDVIDQIAYAQQRTREEAMSSWNRSAPGRWRELHRAASQLAMRETGTRPNMLCWSWEYQRRADHLAYGGALHKHIPLGMATPGERRAARVYMNALEQLGGTYGFGFVSDTRRGKMARAWRKLGPERIPAERAARYIAKYLSPLDRSSGKPTMSQTVTHSDVPPLVLYVSRKLTVETKITMRYLRHVRKCWVLKIHPDTGETWTSILARAIKAGDVDEIVAWSARLHPA